MKKRLRIMAPVLLLAGLASSQSNSGPVQIDDKGAVLPAHQHRHVKYGEALNWGRTTAGASWTVEFGVSPCLNKVKSFGSASDKLKTCVIVVHCSKPGDASCIYSYNSATGADQPQNDPDVIVDN